MASTGSREIQEDIVGPLMDMMGSLSEGMRKNLSKEVSSINRRLDELSNKVDYLISRTDGNNFRTKERDQQTPDKADIDTNLPYKKMSWDQNQKDDTLSKGTTDEVANKSIPAMATYPGQSQKIGEKSKNQQPAPSGFKNEHGDDDNRFIAAAHDERPHASVMRRGFDLSNLKLVKNGPRRPVNGTGTSSRRPDGGATELLQLPEKSLMQEDNGSGKLVSDDVLYSLIEQERLSAGECSDIKSHGIDTVICLDTSSSMAGKPLTTAIHTVTKILDGFETNAIYHDLEENVALVTFGNENKIRCHLTNDYGVIREGLENITAGGPSPLWLGLALSLAEIKERGGACIMDPTTVLPRIILITDGFASRKNLLVGEDSSVVDDQVIREILSLMSTCTSFTSYMECIIPSPCHEEFLSSLTNGRMYTTDDLEHVVEFFRVQEKANDIVKKVSSGEMDRSEIGEAINTSKLGEKGKDDLKKMLSEGLSSDVCEDVRENEHSNTCK
ncbi:uncharacterized protein LOC123566003 isoform X2 [Mercenaria mercenaria]|uniref:uncharacterized protein LOC123566003 isoform X2 n=1 Tax=Mercenaria mercenaria TaxID=6596 RepID=UPI00234F6F9B|nr:uncharacterized protein LOC123566003 isoform X2 [Mercenaria mercenaria]